MTRTVLVDGKSGTWEPSELFPGCWDLVSDEGQSPVYPLSGWSRREIEATWPPVMEVAETEEVA